MSRIAATPVANALAKSGIALQALPDAADMRNMDLTVSLLLTALVSAVVAAFGTSHWYRAKLRACAERTKAQRGEIQQLEVRLKEAKQQVGTLKTALAAVPPSPVARATGTIPPAAGPETKRTASLVDLAKMLQDEPDEPKHGFADTMPFAGSDR